jgi:hypothetical protein
LPADPNICQTAGNLSMNRESSKGNAILVPIRALAVAVIVAVACVAAAGCDQRTVTVEEYADGEWRELPWELTQTSVQRSGASVLANFVVEGVDDERLLLETKIELTPQASFSVGRWTRIAGTNFRGGGSIQSTSVEFLGGQGGAPSVGGLFMLRLQDGTDRYRIDIPPTEARVMAPPGS